MRSVLRAAIIACALLSAPLAAAQTQASPGEPVFTAEGFRAHVQFLADDLLEGREAGARGHRIAALYVANQFHGLGLEPAGEAGGWYQTVPLQERRLSGVAKLTVAGAGGDRAFENGGEVIIAPSALEPRIELEAPVVFVGFGLDAPKSGFDDYRGLDVRGKVVVYLDGTPKGTPSEIGAHLNREKPRMAMARGAVGVISLSTLLSEKTTPWSKRTPGARNPRMAWVGRDGKPFVETPHLRVTAAADTAAGEALFAGARRTVAEVRAEADRPGGRPRGFPLKTRARFDVVTEYRTTESPNVLGIIRGSDPALRDEVVMVMAHLDHLGVRPDLAGPDKIYNGAMDNAAGVAAMLETARAVAGSGARPRRSVLFMASTGEEKGLLGADYFGAHPLVPLERIAGLVNIDMPILTYDFGDIVPFGGESSTMGEAVRRAGERLGIRVSPDPTPEQGIFTRSDHYALVKRGVPAVFLKTGPMDAGGGQGGVTANARFRATEYHEPSDELDLPFDWKAAAKFARVNWMITRQLADADQRPRWYRGDFFGEQFAREAPKAERPAR